MKIINIVITFILISITWVFFRANNIKDAFHILQKICFERGILFSEGIEYGLCFIVLLIASDIFQERNGGKHLLLENQYRIVRYISYITIIVTILAFGVLGNSQFIYFQF
jgi:hypothetical protein